MALEDYRSRLFLVMPRQTPPDLDQRFAHALSGGDIACLLMDGETDDSHAYARWAAPYVQTAQSANLAVLVQDDARLADQLDADGVHISDPKSLSTQEQAAHQSAGRIIGIGGLNTRHVALQVGEREPDYVFFGRLDRDLSADNHPKTENLAPWWAQMMAIPCVAMAGASDAAVTDLAKAGVEFIAVREQIWTAEDPGAEISRLNESLDQIAHERQRAAA